MKNSEAMPAENRENGREYLISRVLDELDERLKYDRASPDFWDWLDSMHDRTLLKILSKERRAMYEDYLSKEE